MEPAYERIIYKNVCELFGCLVRSLKKKKINIYRAFDRRIFMYSRNEIV